MTTEQTLNKLHEICATFPQIKYRGRDNKTQEQTCFAYRYVSGNKVYVSFRIALLDVLRACKELRGISREWHLRKGVWLTIPINEATNWSQVRLWIAKSYRVVAGKKALVYSTPAFLKQHKNASH